MNKHISLLILLLLNISRLSSGELNYVGIPRAKFDYAASSQQTQMWCWAASIEMVLKYYGVNLSQRAIVQQTYGNDGFGNPPPWGANIDIISRRLNHMGVDDNGARYSVRSTLVRANLHDGIFLRQLQLAKPIIIAYGPNMNEGHVVVLTASGFTVEEFGPVMRTLVVRDPFPTPWNVANIGRIEYLNIVGHPQGIPAPVQAAWLIDVTK